MAYADFDDDDQDGEEEDDLGRLYVSFLVDETRYALPVTSVLEIINVERLVALPDLPPQLRGVVNLRGNVVPVLDLRVRLALPQLPLGRRSTALILQHGSELLAVLVDGVNEVVDITPEQIADPPQLPRGDDGRRGASLVRGVTRGEPPITVILDPTLLLADNASLALHPAEHSSP